MKVFIGGSSRDVESIYYENIDKLALYLSKANYNLLIGCDCGLVGYVQDLFSKYKSKVSIMEALPYKKDNYKCEVYCYDTICERKSNLINNANLIVFLPGGIGTLDEIFTAIESKRAKEYDVPIVIININNYYDELISLLDKIYREKFADLDNKQLYYIACDVDDAIKYIEKLGDKVENK